MINKIKLKFIIIENNNIKIQFIINKLQYNKNLKIILN